MRILCEEVVEGREGFVRDSALRLGSYVKKVRESLLDRTYASPETALAAAYDTDTLAQARKLASAMSEVRTVILVGIGGSDLGTRAVFDALSGPYANTFRTPRLFTASTIEPRLYEILRKVIHEHKDPREVALVVISKSGTTAETIANAQVLYRHLCERFGKEAAQHQTIVLTEASSSLGTYAEESGLTCVSVPSQVGGRYSLFTATSLVPLALLGINVEELLLGAREGAEASASERREVTGAVLLAALLAHAYEKEGLPIHEHFMFAPELETLGKWYRQLLAESVGKERSDGTRVGLMPTVAIGSTDLHSLGQLIYGGPIDRFTTFVAAPSDWEATEPFTESVPFSLPMFTGKTPGDLLRAIYEGVTHTYHTHGLPFVRIELAGITPRELGKFMAVEMVSVMYLAQLLDVNAFDQPDVEAYKTEAKRRLAL